MPTCPNCAHEFSEAPAHVLPLTDNVVVFNDFRALIDDVLVYVRQNPGVRVISSDNPMTRRIGFDVLETGAHKRWEIPLTQVQRSFLGNEAMTVYRSYLMTSAGRAVLTHCLNQGFEPTEPFPPFIATSPL